MTKKEILQKVAKWEIHPTDAEDYYEGTNLYDNDREKLKESVKRIRLKQGKFKKFLVDHPILTTLGGTALGAGAGIGIGHLAGNKAMGGMIGGLLGTLGGGATSSTVIENENEKAYKDFEKNNKGFLNRFYKNPYRAKFRNDQKANKIREDQLDALRTIAETLSSEKEDKEW